MIARLGLSTLWLLVGGAAAGGVYWGFLNTPESSIGALLLSVVLFALSVALVAVTLNGALLLWSAGWSRDLIRRSIVRIPAIVPPAILVLLAWYLTSIFRMWVYAHSGEISALFIARLGWADIAWLFTTMTWMERWVMWVLAPFLALSWLARSPFSPLRLLLASLWFGVLVVLPWVYLAPWRPRGIPATSVELVFITVKLGVTLVIMAIGTSLMIGEVVRHGRTAGRS